MPQPAVNNAADVAQVKRAGRKDKDRGQRRLELARLALSTEPGRAFLWDQLESLGVFRSIYSPSAQIYYSAGRQDYGHELMALLLEADENAFDVMHQEARARAKADAREVDAAHTTASEETQK